MNSIVIKSSDLKKKDVNAVLQGIFLKCGNEDYPILAQVRTVENYGKRVEEINETTISLMVSVLKDAVEAVAETFLRPLYHKLTKEQLMTLTKGPAGRELIRTLPSEMLSLDIVEEVERNILSTADKERNLSSWSMDDSFLWLSDYFGESAFKRYKNVKVAAGVLLHQPNCPVELIEQYKDEKDLQGMILRTEYAADTDAIKLAILNQNAEEYSYLYSQNHGKLRDKFRITYAKRMKEETTHE